MKHTNKAMRKSITGIILLVVLVSIFAVLYSVLSEKTAEGNKNITVSVVLTDGEFEEFKFSTNEEYLGEVLLSNNLIEGTESIYGLFVEKVNGISANQENNEWWCLTKNGTKLTTGVIQHP